MLFFHPVRRARRRIQPRSVRKVLHPVRSTVWTASGVGRKSPPRRKAAANSAQWTTSGALAMSAFAVVAWVVVIAALLH